MIFAALLGPSLAAAYGQAETLWLPLGRRVADQIAQVGFCAELGAQLRAAFVPDPGRAPGTSHAALKHLPCGAKAAWVWNGRPVAVVMRGRFDSKVLPALPRLQQLCALL